MEGWIIVMGILISFLQQHNLIPPKNKYIHKHVILCMYNINNVHYEGVKQALKQ